MDRRSRTGKKEQQGLLIRIVQFQVFVQHAVCMTVIMATQVRGIFLHHLFSQSLIVAGLIQCSSQKNLFQRGIPGGVIGPAGNGFPPGKSEDTFRLSHAFNRTIINKKAIVNILFIKYCINLRSDITIGMQFHFYAVSSLRSLPAIQLQSREYHLRAPCVVCNSRWPC